MKVTFIQPDGVRHEAVGMLESTLMQCAMDNGIPGVNGECGGCCSCATCHAYVDHGWAGAFAPVSDLEDMTLECVENRKGNSRLLCQLVISSAADGVVVHLPEES